MNDIRVGHDRGFLRRGIRNIQNTEKKNDAFATCKTESRTHDSCPSIDFFDTDNAFLDFLI